MNTFIATDKYVVKWQRKATQWLSPRGQAKVCHSTERGFKGISKVKFFRGGGLDDGLSFFVCAWYVSQFKNFF